MSLTQYPKFDAEARIPGWARFDQESRILIGLIKIIVCPNPREPLDGVMRAQRDSLMQMGALPQVTMFAERGGAANLRHTSKPGCPGAKTEFPTDPNEGHGRHA